MQQKNPNKTKDNFRGIHHSTKGVKSSVLFRVQHTVAIRKIDDFILITPPPKKKDHVWKAQNF